MYFDFKYHKKLDTLHIGCEKPRAYFIPYSDECTAKSDDRNKSEFFFPLCGEWDFKYYSSVNDIDDFLDDEFSREAFDKITVPKSWQMEFGRGYDEPHYTNHNYAIPVDPPYIPEDNPCGLYIRDFYIDEDTLQKKNIFINFEGVDSCFYLFVNDCFAGYSEVSHTTSEFDISKYLHAGNNTLKVVVLKWCVGTYLEDQDKFRLSGIFREVYLLYRERNCIRDIFIEPSLNEDFSIGTVRVSLDLYGEASVVCKLLDADGETLCEQVLDIGKNSLEWTLNAPRLWSDECPELYTLLAVCTGEYLCFDVGFRRIEIKNKVVYINGKKVKARGINRHDTHPLYGAAVPLEMLYTDMYIVKANNMNMVRASHYPNDPRLLSICDRLGIYLIDEADLECHGMFRPEQGGVSFSDMPEWREAYLDRMERMVERDKNHPSVIIWSPGNESDTGSNMRAMADYVHRRIGGSIFIDNGATNHARDNELSDNPTELDMSLYSHYEIETSMYRSYDMYVEKMIKNPKITRPLLLIEHSHAMGNSPGCLYDYWQKIYEHDEFFGGCVWEMTDHAVNIGTPDEPKYLYGGDLGDNPHDNNFCVDGLLNPDRTPHSGMLEYKQIIKPFYLVDVDIARKTFIIKSLRCFKSLSDLDAHWNIEKNGEKIYSGIISALDVPPQSEREFSMDIPDDIFLDGECVFNVSLCQNLSLPWAEAGYEIGFEQRILTHTNTSPISVNTNDICVLTRTRKELCVHIGESIFTVDKIHGVVSSIVDGGKEMLASPILPNIMRAPIDNDRYLALEWNQSLYPLAKPYCRECSIVTETDKHIRISAELVLASNARRPILKIHADYDITPEQGLTVSFNVQKREGLPYLPRFGVGFRMPSENERIKYFGRGDTESYIDKRHASKMGVYETTVTDNFYHYIKPQENMAHTDTKWFTITNCEGRGLLFLNTEQTGSLSFNCSHYSVEQLMNTKHDFELVQEKETIVYIDLKQHGIGSESCGLALDERWRFSETEFGFSFRIQPVDIDNVDPFNRIF